MTALTTNPIRRPGPILSTLAVVALALVVGIGLMYAWINAPAAATVPYSQFLTDVEAGRVTRVVQTGTTLEVSVAGGQYLVTPPTILTDVYGDVQAAAADRAAAPEFLAEPEPDTSWIGLVLSALLPFAVVLVVFALVLLLIVRPAQAQGARSLAVRLRELDDAHRSGLIADDQWQRQRARILDEA